MNSNDIIINLILSEYQKFLNEIAGHKVEENGIRYGIPPKSIIVKWHDIYAPNEFKIGNILGAWRVFLDKIETLDDLNCEPAIEPKDGMYHNEGFGFFSIKDAAANVCIEWYVGPRYGIRYIYKVISNGKNSMEVIRDKMIWVS